NELEKERSEKLIDRIVDRVEGNEKIFGENAKYLNPDVAFVGKQADEFRMSLKKNLRELVKEEKFSIVQSTHCMCIHDLSRPQDLKCQAGYDMENIVTKKGTNVSRCEGANCSNSIFFEEDVKKLKEIYGHIDDEIKERLERNTVFMETGGFENVPYHRLFKQYDEYCQTKDAV
ncbi:hypothetical protein DZA35_00375, partial [Arcobacter sp. HD9-500m-PIT-SAG03]